MYAYMHTHTHTSTRSGLGKTTLAHVVARHCGYHPYEINASDDRTATSLTQRVTDAVQMKPVSTCCVCVCVVHVYICVHLWSKLASSTCVLSCVA